ncbi:DUF2884 family protein [Enterovibrio calviensis]|uniref:DUF2884 family protein n=1 Tax=Enterovibrio calviensis TaxID=91359 RepID=UPI0004860F9C|nr:DUF2884 family protein [Enterovibrio calviensis]
MGSHNHTYASRVFCFILATLPFFATAETCQPELHGNLAIEADNVVFENNNDMFRIDATGNLFYDVHRVALSDAQRASLTEYNQIIRTDLPFIGRTLTEELHTSWLALDGVISAELGEKSELRGEVGKFHQYLQDRVNTSLYSPESLPVLNHQALTLVVREVEASIPQLIATVASRGLMDIALLSEGKSNKMQFISQKMATLQDKLEDEVKQQRNRTLIAQQEVCERFEQWQMQEAEIASLIPALSGWKTVTIR